MHTHKLIYTRPDSPKSMCIDTRKCTLKYVYAYAYAYIFTYIRIYKHMCTCVCAFASVRAGCCKNEVNNK